MRSIAIILTLLFCTISLSKGNDGDEILDLQEYYLLVMENHPVARQAKLIRQRADLSEMEGRGVFDPKLVSRFESKEFNEDQYYQLWDTYVHIPTITSIGIKAGYENNDGIYLNPENQVPTGGLYYAGISVPLGRGFLMNNAERISREKAMLSKKDLENQSEKVLNNLLLDANHYYWNWYASLEKMKLAMENMEVINERFQGIRQGVINGDNAAIDSVETLIQVQQFQNNLRKAEVDCRNAVLMLSNFLWNTQIETDSIAPELIDTTTLPDVQQIRLFAMENHPEIRSVAINLSELDLDRKWNAEQLKPLLNVNYNFLIEPDRSDPESAFNASNYKGGIEFKFPLFIRKERARLKITKTKIEENKLKLELKKREISVKIEQYYNKLQQLTIMIGEQEKIVRNYNQLLEGERTKFRNGESSVFLINSRENQKLIAEQKLIDLNSAYGMTLGLLYWSGNMLASKINNDPAEN